LTTAERIAAIDAALDAVYTALSTGDGIGPLDVQYMQDPDGGQVTFRSRSEALEYVKALRAERAELVEEQAAEADSANESGPIILVRRRL